MKNLIYTIVCVLALLIGGCASRDYKPVYSGDILFAVKQDCETKYIDGLLFELCDSPVRLVGK